MKLFIIAALVLLIGGGLWLASDCNNKLPFKSNQISQMQSQHCMCSKSTIKVQGINESKCATPHTDSVTPCTAYDHCSLPEQCVRQNQTEFACKYVQGGCYEFIDVGNVVKEKCY